MKIYYQKKVYITVKHRHEKTFKNNKNYCYLLLQFVIGSLLIQYIITVLMLYSVKTKNELMKIKIQSDY